MQPELDEKSFGMVPADRIEAFYRAYHKYLKENGVDGVKVGDASVLEPTNTMWRGLVRVRQGYPRGSVTRVDFRVSRNAWVIGSKYPWRRTCEMPQYPRNSLCSVILSLSCVDEFFGELYSGKQDF